MTVNSETPFNSYTGNNTTVAFAFTWSSDDDNEVFVSLDGVLLTDNIEYTIEDYDPANGGSVVFATTPTDLETVLIDRRTPVTQQVDYTDAPFESKVHEDQLDKDTRILQEEINGAFAGTDDGVVDLDAIAQENGVLITNSAGEDALIPNWNPSTLDLAGVVRAEITDAAPANGAATTKPDGYIWYEKAP